MRQNVLVNPSWKNTSIDLKKINCEFQQPISEKNRQFRQSIAEKKSLEDCGIKKSIYQSTAKKKKKSPSSVGYGKKIANIDSPSQKKKEKKKVSH